MSVTSDCCLERLFLRSSQCDPAGRHRASPLTDACLRRIVEDIVADVFEVPRDALHQPTRGRARVAFARQAAMYLAHVAWGLQLTEVGRIFGRDRTTVAHACEVIEDRRDNDALDRTLDLLTWALSHMREREEAVRELHPPAVATV